MELELSDIQKSLYSPENNQNNLNCKLKAYQNDKYHFLFQMIFPDKKR